MTQAEERQATKQQRDEVEAVASVLNDAAEESGAAGGVLIAALTLLLAVWLDRVPANMRNEIRERVVRVIEGKPA